jgi:hypothetical protein
MDIPVTITTTDSNGVTTSSLANGTYTFVPETLKAGRVLSGANAGVITAALQQLLDVLRRAGVDVSTLLIEPEDTPEEVSEKAMGADKLIGYGGAVKSLGNGRVGGYLVMWGDTNRKDLTGEYFKSDTEFGLHWYERRPALYHHGLDDTLKDTVIGNIDTLKADTIGLWAEAQLDLRNQYVRAVQKLVEKGALGWSSGSLPHLVEIETDGRIKRWIIVEGSLTPTPAEPRILATLKTIPVVPLKGLEVAEEVATAPVDSAHKPELAQADPTEPPTEEPQQEKPKVNRDAVAEFVRAYAQSMGSEMSDEEVNAAVDAILALFPAPAGAAEGEAVASVNTEAEKGAFVKAVQDGVLAILNRRDMLSQLQSAGKAAVANARPQSQTNGYQGSQVTVSEPRKYWHMDEKDLQFAYLTMKADRRNVSEELLTVMAGRTVKAMEAGDETLNHPAVKSLIRGVKANEIATSTASTGGDEWVGVAYSTSLWEKARENRVYEQLVSKGMRVEEVPQGHESVVISTEGADPTVYTLAQSTAVDATNRPTVNVTTTRIVTGRATLTPGILGMAVAYTDELEEDSLIPVAAQFRRQMEEKAQETVEQLFINGDTETGASTNINLIDGTPGTGLTTPYYIASNGALKYALVTGTSTSRDGGALTDADYRLTLKLLPSAVRHQKAKMAYIIDPDTHNTSLDIAAIKTEDVRHTNATIASGMLTNIYGIDVLESGLMPLANNVGKVPNAGGTLGRILLVYAPFWAVGWKRKVTFEVQKDALAGVTVIVAKMRLGFLVRGAGAAVASYNLTIA